MQALADLSIAPFERVDSNITNYGSPRDLAFTCLIASLARTLNSATIRRHLVDQTVALVARVPSLFSSGTHIGAVRDLLHGAFELLLGEPCTGKYAWAVWVAW